MLGLPKSTELNKRIPKQKFYEKLTVTPQLKRIFVDQIKAIYWRNKIAATTMNLAPGSTVTEVEVFEVTLLSLPLDISVLRQIDKEIPYHIIFLLEHEDKYQAWTAYKEANVSGRTAFKVGEYYHTNWVRESELPLRIDGLSVDKIYENFFRQIAGNALEIYTSNETLKESLEREEKRKAIQKQIDQLQARIRKEKQMNLQMEMNKELKIRKQEMETMR